MALASLCRPSLPGSERPNSCIQVSVSSNSGPEPRCRRDSALGHPPPQMLWPGPNSGGPRRIPSVPPASPPRLRLPGCGAPGLPGPAPANRSSPHTPLRQPIPGGPAAPPPPPPGVQPPPGPRAPLGQPGVSSPPQSGREPQFPTRPFSLLPNQESPPPASSPRRSACSAGQRGPNPFPLRA